jgi:hypothetical protein
MIPVPGYDITTPYGKRGPYWSCDRDAYGNGIHTGADLAAPVGTKVVAARPGTAVYCNHGAAFGNHQLEVRAGDGTRDFYAHMPSRAVANGAHVDAGDKVGTVGAEGNVTGSHLHFERHATETGGWSCAVVRDPAPSINYLPSGSGGSSSGEDGDDMPDYARARHTQPVKLTDGNWYPIEWGNVDNGADYFDKGGGASMNLGGKRYSATLAVDLDHRARGAKLQTSWVELKDKEAQETSPTASHGEVDLAVDTRNGKVGDGRRLRARVRVSGGDATLKSAQIDLLAF